MPVTGLHTDFDSKSSVWKLEILSAYDFKSAEVIAFIILIESLIFKSLDFSFVYKLITKQFKNINLKIGEMSYI